MVPEYSGATRVIFIVGDPITQVKSPAGVTESLRARGADAVVVPAHVAPADLAGWVEAVGHMRNCDGIIVTVPHKFAVLPMCRALSPQARSIAAVNVMRRDATGAWFGDMVDGRGYITALQHAGCDVAGRRALLVGAGGAGAAIAHALVDAGVASLALHDTDAVRCERLVAQLATRGAVTAMPGAADPAGFDLVINATTMGMQADDPLPIDATRLAPGTFVGDVITVPPVTPLVAAARARGCPTLTGTQMFEAVRDRIIDFYLHQP